MVVVNSTYSAQTVFMRASAWAGLAVLTVAIALAVAGNFKPPRKLPEGVHSPTLALELIRDGSTVSSILRPDEHTKMARAVSIDYLFIATYTIFFTLLGAVLFANGGWWRLLGAMAILAVIGAAVYDVRENRAMLDLLAGDTARLPRPFSLAKWRLIFIALGATAPVFWNAKATPLRRWVGFAACALALFVAVEGVFAVQREDAKLIEVSARRMAIALVLVEFFLSTERTLRDGVLAALDRLARKPVLNVIANWPSADVNETVGDVISRV